MQKSTLFTPRTEMARSGGSLIANLKT